MMMLATLGTVSHSGFGKSSAEKDAIQFNKEYTSSTRYSEYNDDNFSRRHSSDRREQGSLKSKNRDTRNYEHLCETVSNTVHLNTRHEEFNPPFYVEKRCKKGLNGGSLVQKCGFDLLHCVQTYTTRHFSRRKAGTHCWEPYSIEVPTGCECMWPVDEFGPIQRKEEL